MSLVLQKFPNRPRQRNTVWSALGACAVIAWVSACGATDEAAETEPVIAVAKQRALAAKTNDPQDALREADAYTYNPVGRRDPMASYFDQAGADIPAANGEPETPLTAAELDSLTLVAVVSGTAAPRVVLEDAGGRGHIAKLGTRVGRQRGRVVDIGPKSISVEENYRDYLNRTVAVRKTLRLRRSPLTAASAPSWR